MTCSFSKLICATEEEMLQGYNKVWAKVYPRVQCEDPKVGMFCTLSVMEKATSKCNRWVDDKGNC